MFRQNSVPRLPLRETVPLRHAPGCCLRLANERLSVNRAGQVVLKLKTPYRNGTTHIVMSPLEFMQRLAALVPRPRLHLIRFHGVLAPNAKLRSKVVPPPEQATTAGAGDCKHVPAHSAPVRMSWARLLKRVFDHRSNCISHRRSVGRRSHHPSLSSPVRAGARRRPAPRAVG